MDECKPLPRREEAYSGPAAHVASQGLPHTPRHVINAPFEPSLLELNGFL